MARNKGWQNFYIPENYEDAVAELKERLPGSFSQAMQECLRQLFKKHGVVLPDKPGKTSL